MSKEFNITGTCIPSRHFMADTTEKLRQIMEYVEHGKYFIINRPRQYGKTTIISLLEGRLRQTTEYLVFSISFAGIGDAAFELEDVFCEKILTLLALEARFADAALAPFIKEQKPQIKDLGDLSVFISKLVDLSGKRVVLIIDEVDKSSNNQLFISFLGMLRDKYLGAATGKDTTFHAVILAGVHDVKTLKAKIRPDEEAKYNSPWNIASDFKVEMSLLPHEVVPMLEDYARERNVTLDAPALAERLYHYTSGYPFLVSALCKIFDEDILPEKSEPNWPVEDLNEAARRLIGSERSNTNFDSLIKNLENDQELFRLVYRLVIDSEQMLFNIHDPVIYKGVQYGILRNGRGLNIHNRIFAEVIANYMTAKMITSGLGLEPETADSYLLPGNALNMERVLSKFQGYMREQYSLKDREFLERQGRLVFLAFLKPIINGRGYAFKEPELSEERRLDIAVTFMQHRYAVELKVWRGEAAHERGLAQLSDYLERNGLIEGYLVIFDQRSKQKSWRKEWTQAGEKRVFAVWV